jgi:hypothetical protein
LNFNSTPHLLDEGTQRRLASYMLECGFLNIAKPKDYLND